MVKQAHKNQLELDLKDGHGKLLKDVEDLLIEHYSRNISALSLVSTILKKRLNLSQSYSY
jgi:hypothetical protein